MSNVSKFYLERIHETSNGYRGTWPPSTSNLEIGSIITLDDNGGINIQSSLEKQHINYQVKTDEFSSDMDCSSGSGIDITTKAQGSAPVTGSLLTDADAGFTIQFKSDKSIVFKISGYKVHQIINLAEVGQAVLEKYKNGSWQKEWLIVANLIKADSGTIIIAEKRNTSLDLKAKAAVSAGQLKITDTSLGLTVARENGSTNNYIAQSGITPLYKCQGLKNPLFGRAGLHTRDLGSDENEENLTLQEIGLEETDSEVLEIDGSEF